MYLGLEIVVTVFKLVSPAWALALLWGHTLTAPFCTPAALGQLMGVV